MKFQELIWLKLSMRWLKHLNGKNPGDDKIDVAKSASSNKKFLCDIRMKIFLRVQLQPPFLQRMKIRILNDWVQPLVIETK